MNKLAVLITAGAALLSGCMDKPLEPTVNPEQDFKLQVRNFSATYLPEQNRVLLQWDPPSHADKVDFYRVYRSTNTAVLEDSVTKEILTRPDTSEESFQSIGARRRISRDSTSFLDLLDLANTTYWYGIRSVRVMRGIDHNGVSIADTVEGQLSEIARAEVSSGVLFSINSGDAFAVRDKGTVTLIDPENKVKSLQFTQIVKKYLVKVDEEGNVVDRELVATDDPYALPSNTRIHELVAGGWITRFGKLGDMVQKRTVPVFGAHDASNEGRTHVRDVSDMSEVTSSWALRKGNGLKEVWARTIDDSGKVDTLRDEIRIAPFGNNDFIKLTMLNETEGRDRTMRYNVKSTGTEEYILYYPRVEFGVSIFADTTVSLDFDYWLAFSNQSYTLNKEPGQDEKAWIETQPMRGRLTGNGPLHNDQHRYVYDFGPQANGNNPNISKLLITTDAPGTFDAVTLSGERTLNETAVPGSFWGRNPVTFDNGTLKPIQIALSGSDEVMYERLLNLYAGDLWSYGKKELVIFARFTGKYFNDTRMAMIKGKDFGFDATRAYIDRYAPKMAYAREGENFFNNGEVLGPSFTLELESVLDGGSAYVDEIQLVIARWSEGRTWDVETTPGDLAPQDLYTINGHRIFPFELRVLSSSYLDVKWTDIDASKWPSGNYVMGVVTKDQYGNEGFAPITTTEPSFSNPWLVNIQTGR
jgi:hypothetical protein